MAFRKKQSKMKESMIERYIELLHTILSDRAQSGKEGSGDFISYINEFFGFETEFGGNMLLNAIYVFQDTELAKKDINTFGFQGPCRHKNDGEKYLRLYGILSSVYQQRLAVINFMEIFKLAAKNEYKEMLENSDCIQLRNKIAAHPSNYQENRDDNHFFVYEISRPELRVENVRLMKNQEQYEEYDIKKALDKFDKLIEQILTEILEKFIKKKFQNNGKYYQEFAEIEDLKKGILHIKLPANI